MLTLMGCCCCCSYQQDAIDYFIWSIRGALFVWFHLLTANNKYEECRLSSHKKQNVWQWCDLYGTNRALDSLIHYTQRVTQFLASLFFTPLTNAIHRIDDAKWIITEKCHWLGWKHDGNKSKFVSTWFVSTDLFWTCSPFSRQNLWSLFWVLLLVFFINVFICHNLRNFLRIYRRMWIDWSFQFIPLGVNLIRYNLVIIWMKQLVSICRLYYVAK